MTTPTESVHVRLPRDLIEHLRQQAEEQGTTLNAYLLLVIAQSSGFALDAKKGGVRERAGLEYAAPLLRVGEADVPHRPVPDLWGRGMSESEREEAVQRLRDRNAQLDRVRREALLYKNERLKRLTHTMADQMNRAREEIERLREQLKGTNAALTETAAALDAEKKGRRHG